MNTIKVKIEIKTTCFNVKKMKGKKKKWHFYITTLI